MRGAGDLIGTAKAAFRGFDRDMGSMSSLMATAQSDTRKLINDIKPYISAR